MAWKNWFGEGKEIILATCSDKKPNANIVISLGFVDDRLLVANCQMTTTIRNLRKNNKMCVIGGYYRLRGSAKLFTSGKYFDICVKKTKKYKVKTAILFTIREVFDLNNVKKIK